MTDSATPAAAPDAHASVDERHAYVMTLLHEAPKKTDATSKETVTDDAKPTGETQEPEEAATEESTGETDESEGQPETEAPEEEEGADPEEADEKPKTFKVKVDGEEVEVTLDEALKGYSRLEDYKRKTAKLAEDRRAFERERDEDRAKRSTVEGDYLTLAQQANEDALLLATAEKVDWEKLAQVDTNKYTLLKAKVEAAADRMQKATEAHKTKRQGYLKEQFEKACEHIPEYADEKSRPKFVADMGELMSEVGYSPEEVRHLGDHRAMRIIAEVLSLRAFKAKTEEAAKKLAAKKEKAPDMINPQRRIPSNANGESKRELKAKINKTSDLRERAALTAEYARRFPNSA